MADSYRDNRNERRINGFVLQEVAYHVWAIDEFGIDIMYLIIGTKRALLIDTGIGLSDIRGVVESMTNLPYDVVNSHHHYDHVGGNFHFDCAYVHPAAMERIHSQNNEKSRTAFLLSQEARKEYSYEASLRYECRRYQDAELNRCKLLPLADGDLFDLGDRRLRVIYTPGHTADSICLLDQENRLLFSADTVVSTPTLIFKNFSATLSEYIASLQKLKELSGEYELIFPGHYLRPIGGLYVDQLIKCGQEIETGQVAEVEEENGMAGAPVYGHQHGRASILYTKDRIGETDVNEKRR